MRKIKSNFFISLDGVVESPDKWHFPYFNDEIAAAVDEGIQDARGLLMGRKLYDEWSSYWPTSTDEPFASFINSTPKYVVSSTLHNADWTNTTIVSGDVAGQLRQLKEEPGDIAMSGSATLVRWLLANGLLDELNLLIHPIAVGRGRRLFEDTPTHPLRLTHQKTFETGVLHVKYAPAEG